MSEFLAAAKGQYTFDCICGHWYGGQDNDLAADQSMIASQMGEMAALASQYGIEEIVIAEMQRVNGDQEVRFSFILATFPSVTGQLLPLSTCDMGADDRDGFSASS